MLFKLTFGPTLTPFSSPSSPFQMRQGSAKQVVSALQQKQKKEVGYQTKVVAGVVHRTPIQVCTVYICETLYACRPESSSVHVELSQNILSSPTLYNLVHCTCIVPQSTGNSDAGPDSETAQGGAGVSSVGRGDSISRRTSKGIPRVIKAGHAIKLGAVVRFCILLSDMRCIVHSYSLLLAATKFCVGGFGKHPARAHTQIRTLIIH